MDDKLRELFNDVHAEADLKESTRRFLHKEIKKRHNKPAPFLSLRLVALAASLLLFAALCTTSVGMFFTASAYVDIDVNPSIELTVNRFGRVISVNPYNEGGAKLLASVDVKYASYQDAISSLLGVAAEQGYMYDAKLLSVTLQAGSGNAETSMLDKLQSAVDTSLHSHHSNVKAEVFSVSEELKGHAHANHVSPAKYLAITDLQSVDPTTNFDECAAHSISEIKEMTKAHHQNGHHNEATENNPSDQLTSDESNACDNCDDGGELDDHSKEHNGAH